MKARETQRLQEKDSERKKERERKESLRVCSCVRERQTHRETDCMNEREKD